MIVLEFVGRDAESDALLFTDKEGTEYTAALSESLRTAILRGVTLETVEGRSARPLSPGQIQSLLREGMTAEQVSEQTGTEIARVRRFEGPVLAEIARAIEATRSSQVGTERDAPTIGDLVVDRLAERGVDTEALDWRAARRGPSWEVTVAFVEGDVERIASWTLSEPGNLAVAADDAARELTESARVPEPVRALFPPVHPSTLEPFDVAADGLLDRQEQLLKRLNAARGRRQPVMLGFDGTEEEEALSVTDVEIELGPEPEERSPLALAVVPGTGAEDEDGPEPNSDGLGVEVSAERDEEVPPAADESEAESATEVNEVEEVVEAPRKRGRTPVPSWDEIVFGSRGD